jgi:hypothetical protein
MSFAQVAKTTKEQSIDDAFKLLKTQKGVSYFDVSKEMFQMLSESKNANPEFKEYVKKLTGMKMVRVSSRDKIKIDIYSVFIDMTNLKGFSRLMTSENPTKKISFYQKKSKNENEYLLVQTNTIIYVTGTIDLKSIGEFEQIMEIAGSAFEM